MKNRDFPSPGAAEIVEELLNQDPIAIAIDGRDALQVVLAAIGADRLGDALLVQADHEHEAAIGTSQLAVMAQQRGAIDPVGTT